MSRSMKFGIATIVAAFVVSLMATDEAEARRRGRHHRGRGGCYGYSACCGAQPVGCCGVAVSACQTGCVTGACGVATSACPSGACGVGMGGYSGGYSAGYGSSVQGRIYSNMPPAPQGTFDQGAPPLAPNGSGTFREERRDLNGSSGTRSPSDRGDNQPPPPPGAGERSPQPADREADRSAPPPPSQEQ